MTTFAVELDGRPVTWTALAGEWYRRSMVAPNIGNVSPLLFDVAAGLAPGDAVNLAVWMQSWLGDRVKLQPEIPEVSG